MNQPHSGDVQEQSGGPDGDRPFNLKLPQLKMLAYVAVIVIVGITLMTVTDLMGGGDPEAPADSPQDRSGAGQLQGPGSDLQNLQAAYGESLRAILADIQGVGAVGVRVTLSGMPESRPASNISTSSRTTQEEDDQGGSRTISETSRDQDVVLVQSATGGGQDALIEQVVRPEVHGVLVVAQGAGDPRVREMVFDAVTTVMDVPAHRVRVLPAQGGNE